MLRVGLTGGIATGKSRVLGRLAAAGCVPLDLDRIAHEAIEPGGPAHAAVVEAFGTPIVGADGRVDRRRLGAIVFADAEARRRLEALVHPAVRAEEARRAAAHAGRRGAVVVSDAALLVETGLHLRFDRLVVVDCRPEQQLERLLARDGLGREAAEARLAAQLPGELKRRFAHDVIDSSASPEDTDRAADALAARLLALAAEPPSPLALAPECATGVLAQGPSVGPRGLTPEAVVRLVAAQGGLDLGRLARALAPPATGGWLAAARPHAGDPGPEQLAGAVLLAGLPRSRCDAAWLAGAATALARLTHVEAARIAGAVVAALALLEAPRLPVSPDRLRGWLETARRWAGGEPEPASLAWLRAAPPGRAEGTLAGALGARRGEWAGAPPAELAALVESLQALAG